MICSFSVKGVCGMVLNNGWKGLCGWKLMVLFLICMMILGVNWLFSGWNFV